MLEYVYHLLSSPIKSANPLATPLDVKATLVKHSQEELEEFSQEMDGVPYKAAVGLLMYAMVATWADLTFAVSVVSQFIASPAPLHLHGCQMHHAILEGHIECEVVPWRY